MEKVTLMAPDISCAHCVATVQQAVGGLEGVESVQADVATKYVTVTYDPNQVELNQIAQVMEEEGYPVAS